jgi:hypothetical protein
VELASLDLLFMVSSLNLRKVQIFGDSKIIVDWVNGKGDIQVACLAARKVQGERILGRDGMVFVQTYLPRAKYKSR